MTPTVIKCILTFSIRECIILSVPFKISWHFFEYSIISSTFICMCDGSLLVSSAFCLFSISLTKVDWEATVIANLVQSPNRSILQRFLASSSHFWSTSTTAPWIKRDKITTTSSRLFSRWSNSGVWASAFSINSFTDCKFSWQVFEKSAIVSKLHYLLRDHKAS